MIKRRIAVLLTTLALALTAGAIASSPAEAIRPPCPKHFLCLYEAHGWEGPWYAAVVEGLSSGTCVNLPAHWRDRANSYHNKTSGYSVRIYDEPGCAYLITDLQPWELNTSMGKPASYRVTEWA